MFLFSILTCQLSHRPLVALYLQVKELSIFNSFSIRMRASTATTLLPSANSGLMSISLISVAKRSRVERRTMISAYFCSLMPCLSARALQNLIAAQRVNHRVGLAIAQRCQTRLHVLQHLDEDAAQSAEHHMSEALLVLGTDKQFGAFQHLLHHDARGTLDLHHAVELQRQVFGSADVQGHAAHVALMDGAYHLGHYGIAHALGEADELVLLGCSPFRAPSGCPHTPAAGARRSEDYIAVLLDAVDDAVQSGNIDTVEFHA